MKTITQINNKYSDERAINAPIGGLPVRTNLRAGLAWDDLDDQAAALWGKLTGAVSSATSALTGGGAAAQK